MYREKLIELGKIIGNLAKAEKNLDQQIKLLDRPINDQKLTLVPVDGWPGKNEAERKIAADKAYNESPLILNFINSKEAMENKLASLRGELEQYEAERRGYEFAVRDAVAEGMGGFKQLEEVDAAQDQAMTPEQVQELAPVDVMAKQVIAESKKDFVDLVIETNDYKLKRGTLEPAIAEMKAKIEPDGMTPGPSLAPKREIYNSAPLPKTGTPEIDAYEMPDFGGAKAPETFQKPTGKPNVDKDMSELLTELGY
jgi:hypothetical protein